MVVQFDSDEAVLAWREASERLTSGQSMDEVGATFFHRMANDKNKNPGLAAVAKIPTVRYRNVGR